MAKRKPKGKSGKFVKTGRKTKPRKLPSFLKRKGK
jgi:hypothetical protein